RPSIARVHVAWIDIRDVLENPHVVRVIVPRDGHRHLDSGPAAVLVGRQLDRANPLRNDRTEQTLSNKTAGFRGRIALRVQLTFGKLAHDKILPTWVSWTRNSCLWQH